MTENKENKRAKRPLNNNQTPAPANETKKKYDSFLHRGKPDFRLFVLYLVFRFLRTVIKVE